MPPALIVCPSCACHAKSVETTCPSCGAPLRAKDGSLPRAAVAMLLGLTTATVGAMSGSCGNGVVATPAYGIAETTSSSGSTGGAPTSSSSSSSSSGGTGGGDGG